MNEIKLIVLKVPFDAPSVIQCILAPVQVVFGVGAGQVQAVLLRLALTSGAWLESQRSPRPGGWKSWGCRECLRWREDTDTPSLANTSLLSLEGHCPPVESSEGFTQEVSVRRTLRGEHLL